MTIRIVNVSRLPRDQRHTVTYVGRAFAGWPASPWGNPFRVYRHKGDTGTAMERRIAKEMAMNDVLQKFRTHAEAQPPAYLDSLWEACRHGELPLGCWCVNAVIGAPSEVDLESWHTEDMVQLLESLTACVISWPANECDSWEPENYRDAVNSALHQLEMPTVCHAQILASLLHERFAKGST